MSYNHLDARALNAPGGPMSALALAIDRAAQGYFQSRDRQEERSLKRDRMAQAERQRTEDWRRRMNLLGFDDEATMVDEAGKTRDLNRRILGNRVTQSDLDAEVARTLTPLQARLTAAKAESEGALIGQRQAAEEDALAEKRLGIQRAVTATTGVIPDEMQITDSMVPLRPSNEQRVLHSLKGSFDQGQLDREAKRTARTGRANSEDTALERALIASATRMLTDLDASPEDQADARAYLAERLRGSRARTTSGASPEDQGNAQASLAERLRNGRARTTGGTRAPAPSPSAATGTQGSEAPLDKALSRPWPGGWNPYFRDGERNWYNPREVLLGGTSPTLSTQAHDIQTALPGGSRDLVGKQISPEESAEWNARNALAEELMPKALADERARHDRRFPDGSFEWYNPADWFRSALNSHSAHPGTPTPPPTAESVAHSRAEFLRLPRVRQKEWMVLMSQRLPEHFRAVFDQAPADFRQQLQAENPSLYAAYYRPRGTNAGTR